MLSEDIRNAAAALRTAIAAVNEGGRISTRYCRVLAANLDGFAEQAAALEGQMAPASPQPDNVHPLTATLTKRLASGAR